jgi:hypothetical protein
MSNVVEGLFLFACLVPPLTVVTCALLLLVKVPSAQRSSAPAHAAPVTH